MLKREGTVNSLHSDLQVANFQRCKRVPSKSGVSETAACPPSPTAGSFRSTKFHLLSLLQSVTLLAWLLDARPCVPAVILYYCTFQGTVL